MTERGSAEAMLEAYGEAVYEKDVDAFVSLYDEDVRVFDLWAPGRTTAPARGGRW